MNVQDVAWREVATKMFEGDVKLVARGVIGTVVRGRGRNPVVDDDLGVDWVPRGQGGKSFGRRRDHLLCEGVEGAGAFLYLVPCYARVHVERIGREGRCCLNQLFMDNARQHGGGG